LKFNKPETAVDERGWRDEGRKKERNDNFLMRIEIVWCDMLYVMSHSCKMVKFVFVAQRMLNVVCDISGTSPAKCIATPLCHRYITHNILSAHTS
jgi:hypothetical protein